jgi:hypothetical protein
MLCRYAFEADLVRLVYSVHDAHVNLFAGILTSFSFASIYDLVTASVDGTSTPQIYISGKLQLSILETR